MENEKIAYNRRRSRINAMYMAYIYNYYPEDSMKEILINAKMIINDLQNNDEYCLKLFKTFFENKKIINDLINTHSEQWSYDRISVINKSILRIAISEKIMKETPNAIMINEYIEITKMYANLEDYKYIHGVIGTIYDNNDFSPIF